MIHARNARPHPTLETDHGDDWRTEARCLRADPELFVPPGSSWQGHEYQEAAAKAYCALCPSVAPCLAWALEVGDEWAVLGDTNPKERRAIKRKEARASA
jgi:WhiB family transcriptional regulator, redox-sensing transcriptional regulator